MSAENLLLEVVDWNEHRELLLSIRGEVFIDEQNVPEAIERDGKDEEATHFLLTREAVPVGCGRILPDGKIGRMAVLQQHRGQGLGRQLLDFIVEQARYQGVKRLYLHAQTHALDFYLSAGFTPLGDEFEEAGIPHSAMELLVDFRGIGQPVSGVTYPEPFATLALELALTARRSLSIYSQQLDREVFDNPEMVSAITALARRSRDSDVRILINDPRPMIKQGHRLLELARRLSSTVHIRVIEEHPELPEATFMLRDNDGTVYKPDERRQTGFYEPDSRAAAQSHIEKFDDLWRWGRVDSGLRLLRL
jgi:predicted GNAT family N-acyltransferase